MSTTFKRIWNLSTSVVVAAIVILALLLAGVRIFGLRVFTVLSGSMEPTYQVGSLIYVKEIDDRRNIPDGTVITYMTGEDTIVTHRVVTAVPDENDPSVVRYRTKGDANDVEDGTMVHYKNIIGTPVYTIPKLGYVATFIQNPPGTYITISFGALFILLLFLPELFGAIFTKEEDTALPELEEEPKPKKEKKQKKEKRSFNKASPVQYPQGHGCEVSKPEVLTEGLSAPAVVEETPASEAEPEQQRRPRYAAPAKHAAKKKKGGAHVIKK